MSPPTSSSPGGGRDGAPDGTSGGSALRSGAVPGMSARGSSGSSTSLLDAVDRGRRILQHGLVLLGVVLLALSGLLFRKTHAGLSAPGAVAGIVGVAAILAGFVVKIRWRVAYRGHEIRFENDPFRGEALFIDGAACARGKMVRRNTLTGVVASGDGAGDRIVAQSEAGYLAFRCRIDAEPAVVPTAPGS